MKIDRRTIVVTAMTGSAAVSINGETAHAAALWNSRTVTRKACQAYKNTVQFVLDECSYANCENFVKNEERLRQLTERSSKPNGGLSIIYAGDMSQLKPVYGNPIYLDQDFELWKGVHTFLELKTNLRFNDDVPSGDLLGRYCDHGPSIPDVDSINERVVGVEDRTWRNVRMRCFQLNVAHARTIHKLQGRSITNLLINVWDYTGNWIYVALSRVRTRKGLFLRLPLDWNKYRGMSNELISWLNKMWKRTPPPEPENDFNE
jgi:hypothetical protein